MDGQKHSSSADEAIADLAGRQHGRVSRVQLLALGLSRGTIEHRIECGRLLPVARGVYAVGFVLQTREAAWMTAVLAAGRGAVLSHRSAAALWNLRIAEGPIEITVPLQRRIPQARLHVSVLPDDEVTELRGLPVTSVSRTLLDLAAVVASADLKRAFDEVEFHRLTDPLGVPRLLARHPGRRGAVAMAKLVGDRTLGLDVPDSDLEAPFRAFLEASTLPRPRWHQPVEDYVPDCVWRRPRVIVELDGRGAHGTWQRFNDDRERDLRLKVAGWTVVRVTWRMLFRDAHGLERALGASLAS